MSTGANYAHIQAFLTKWEVSGAAERANAHLFIAELCDVLGVEHPYPKKPDEAANAYVFEKTIPSITDSSNFIDLYKRGCFVLETKQGVEKHESEAFSQLGQEQAAKRKTGHGVRGTKGWDTAMLRAREQAQRYARALPKEEIADGRPPFILVVDVGHSIALYSDWSRMGGEYIAYPDPATYRIALKDLVRPEVRELLHAVWTDPLSLDPGRRSAKVTREIADRLAKLARSLEVGSPGSRPAGKQAGQEPGGPTGVPAHSPEHVANFLMRCLFTMFSEDVDLLPHGSFTKLLGDLKEEPGNFKEMLENLWGTMNTGGLSPILRKKLPRFNGGLFAPVAQASGLKNTPTAGVAQASSLSSTVPAGSRYHDQGLAIALNADQIQLLIEASTANWKDVEPAIFGTLLERALDPRERHKLGAHYTPRAYVERLVNPTVIEPLREQWKSVQVAALQLAEDGEDKKAIKQVEAFLHQLATVKVLDPACGSGNFLYVTLELLKRLEGEVLNTLHDLGATSKLELEGVMVTPANFFGIELNPRAAAIAEQVLWIGFLQWHLRTHGNLHNLPEPIIKDLHNIQNRDAVLEYDERLPVVTPSAVEGQKPIPLTRWDGHTTKPHAVTGEAVPDPEARVPVYTYSNPRPAKWPAADYIVGNPPFIGTARMREALGDGYTEALRGAYDNVPESADFVMYWWDKAAELTRTGKSKRFGFITTNSLKQTFNRKVLQHHMAQKKPISLAFAIPDHPWVDSADGAAVRVAMTIGVPGNVQGVLQKVVKEVDANTDEAPGVSLNLERGAIHADLTAGADVASVGPLESNAELSSMGVKLHGLGFVLTPSEAHELGYGKNASVEKLIKPYLGGRDLAAQSRERYVIDLFGLGKEDLLPVYPNIYQWVYDRVKPERDQNNRDSYKLNWWVFGEPRKTFRPAISGLQCVIVTPRTAKHRFFVSLDPRTICESEIVLVACDDLYVLGVLSSSIHVQWSLATGGRLGVGNDPRYNNSRCFETFPFPTCTPAQQERIRALGEQLDAHRKRQQALHAELTMTGMYNVLEAVRAGTALTAKEKVIYEQGLVGILKQLHDELDAAVAEAYGWPNHLSTDVILTRLVALNAERAAEEAKGTVRWLRPEYQNKGTAKVTQGKMEVEDDAAASPATAAPREWPDELPAQAAALTEVLGSLSAPASVEEIAGHFDPSTQLRAGGKRTKKRLEEMTRLLETLQAVGRARKNNELWSGA